MTGSLLDAESSDLSRVREQFPALQPLRDESPPVFFDNPAGTQVPRRTVEAIARYLERDNANTHGAFATSRRTDALVERARVLSAAFVGGAGPDEVAFGPNMTSLTYAVSRALSRSIRAGDEVVVSDLDHDANVTPWVDLERAGAVVRRIPLVGRSEPAAGCELDLDAFESMLSPRTRWVAVGLASNAVGRINDVRRIASLARRVGASVFVDAVHYAPHGSIDVQALDADFLVCSAYKFFGPHLGILWGRKALLEELEADHLRPAPASAPEKFENGTKNHECLAGLVATFEYLAELGGGDLGRHPQRALEAGMHRIARHERRLCEAMLEGLSAVRGLRLYGPASAAELDARVPTFGFTLEGSSPAQAARRLAELGICTWAGNHYALTLMERLGLEASGGMLRVGAVHYNTIDEVERLVDALNGLSG